MSYQLGEKREVFCDENMIPESKSPSVFFSGKVVVTGKMGGELELAEKFSMEGEFVMRKKRIFFFI
jgi:hypothetical protein